MKIAVFPGSFDPITRGHEELVLRAVEIFDKVIVAIGINSQKKYMFNLQERLSMLEDVFADFPMVEVTSYEGLTVDFCKKNQSRFLVRGIRNATDFDYESTIAYLNAEMGDGLQTVFLVCRPEFSHFSSTIVREIIKGGGDPSKFLPEGLNLD